MSLKYEPALEPLHQPCPGIAYRRTYRFLLFVVIAFSLGSGKVTGAGRDVQCFRGGLVFETHRLFIDSCITQFKAQGPSRACNESKEEEEGGEALTVKRPLRGGLPLSISSYSSCLLSLQVRKGLCALS